MTPVKHYGAIDAEPALAPVLELPTVKSWWKLNKSFVLFVMGKSTDAVTILPENLKSNMRVFFAEKAAQADRLKLAQQEVRMLRQALHAAGAHDAVHASRNRCAAAADWSLALR